MESTTSLLHSRLTAYAAAGVALAAPVAVSSAHAAIVNSGPRNIAVPNNVDGIYINFVTGATSTGSIAGFDFNPYAGSGGLLFYWGGDAGSLNGGLSLNGTAYANLAPGATISSAGTFLQTANGANNETSAFRGGVGYLGVRFTNEATGVLNYGYVHLSTTAGTGFPATILDYSYENTGAAITVVPEPTTTALAAVGALALGAFGLRRWRQQRATA